MRSIEVLSQISLNLSSVEQFLAIACGLADDNPEIRERIYLAAKEAKSGALLVDHLRSLFIHQHSIEEQQKTQLEGSSDQQQNNRLQANQEQLNYQFECSRRSLNENAQLFTYSNQLTLERAAKCLVANVAKILYLTDSVVLLAQDKVS